MKLTRFRFYAVTLACLFLIVTTVRSLGDILKASGRLDEAKQRLVMVEAEHERLLAQKSWAESDELVERIARNQLGMSRPGETIVVLPDELARKTDNLALPPVPNWQKWARLFFKS